MNKQISTLIRMGKIPNDKDMYDDLFNKYDELIQIEEDITWEEAESIITLFSDDCDDLNWGLIHMIETVLKSKNDVEKYKELINKCNSDEYKELLLVRLDNWLK
ncbi:hypothetical protein ACFIJ5_10865 [Haloimpatiens sp. FM7330]|uniref:hypothetical protein n=1 Tax=Haloimpatiens sp. FM7330 TaxID=3298610 RepID=UPI00362924EE